MRHLTLLLLFVLTAICGLKAFEIGFDDDMRNVFRSSLPAFTALEQLYDQYSIEEGDFLVVLKADDLLSQKSLQLAQEIDLELRSLSSVASVVSMFNARARIAQNGYHPPLFPDLDDSAAVAQLDREQILSHPLLKNAFLSSDARAGVLLVQSKSSSKKISDYEETYTDIKQVLAELNKEEIFDAYVSGIPALQIEALTTSKRDQMRFTLLGGLFGALVAWFLLRQLRPFLVVFIPPLIGVVWTLGFLVLFDQQFTVLTTIIPVLVIIIGFTDSLHLLTACIDELRSGADIQTASKCALRETGPACVLTSVTTAIAFLSLQLAHSSIVQQFGIAGAIGVVLNLISVLGLVPILSCLLLKDPRSWRRTPDWQDPTCLVSKVCHGLDTAVASHYKSIAACGIVLCILFGVLSLNLKSDHRYHENLPAESRAQQALHILEESFGGLSQIRLLVQWPDKPVNTSDDLPKELSPLLASIRTHLETLPHIGSVFSLESIAQGESLDAAKERLPAHILSRLLNEEKSSTVLSAQVQDISSSRRMELFSTIQVHADKLMNQHPDFNIQLSGLYVVSTKQSFRIISDLVDSLGFAILLISLIMTLAFRSLKLGLISSIPNIAPLLACSALLLLIGKPLQYASVIVFTIALGIAVDDTIHYLLRYKRERKQADTVREAVSKTSISIGFVIGTTTLILLAGMSSILLSSVPTLRLFGFLSGFSLVIALLGDVVLLPALLLCLGREKEK